MFNNPSFRKWLWWEPPTDSWLHDFFGYSSIHGLKYISKRKVSFLERIFWIVAFIASLCGSGVMIAQVWNRYHRSPVIVTFNPTEEETYQLPFPAVTICNKSLFSKQKVYELLEKLENEDTKTEAMETLRLVNALCTSRQSFLRRMHLVRPVEFPNWNDINKPPSQRTVNGLVQFIYDHTQPCSHLLRACSWNHRPINCSDFFRPIITDYGKCCVFNKIPNELMDFEKDELKVREKREQGWSFEDILEWQKWDYTNNGFMISDDSIKFPFRQRRAGSLNGLSILADPDIENGYCQSQDSMGVRVLLHTPVDAPRISRMGKGFGLEREVFMQVTPDSTIADKNILDFDYERRKCIFGKAGSILGASGTYTIERPYTRGNCYNTCYQQHVEDGCNCTLHYARRRFGRRVCNPSIMSPDFHCMRHIEVSLAGNYKIDCAMCIYACNYLNYNVESTEASLLEPGELWGNNETNQPPTWSGHKLSILHIYMGSDMHVPKVRQKLYHIVDLVASIGGLLGLTLGFSVLAAIEILYLLTLRVCCKRFRKRQMEVVPDELIFQQIK